MFGKDIDKVSEKIKGMQMRTDIIQLLVETSDPAARDELLALLAETQSVARDVHAVISDIDGTDYC